MFLRRFGADDLCSDRLRKRRSRSALSNNLNVIVMVMRRPFGAGRH
jgi:hypothetical protein